MTWRDITLGELCAEGGGGVQTGPFGSQLHAADYVLDGIPSVMPQNIGDNIIDERDIARITKSDAVRLGRYLLEEGDIVYSRRGDVEKRALVRAHNAGWLCGTGCLRVRVGDPQRADARFVSYLLGAPETRAWISRHAVGATMPNLNTTILSNVPLQIPKLMEQRAIAEVLGALDDKIAANTKLADTASELSQVTYDKGLSGVRMRPISEVLTPVLGGTPARANSDFWGGAHFWAAAKDITGASNAVILSTVETISDLAVDRTKAKPLPIGSVILTARGTVGAVARLAVPASFNQSCYGFTPDQAPPSVLYFGILNAMQRAKAIAHGSVFDTITMKTFDHLEFPHFVDGDADNLEREIAPLLATVVAMVEENRTLAAIRDALLPELMSGRLRVKDAEKKIEGVV